jgi:hypothetical protein
MAKQKTATVSFGNQANQGTVIEKRTYIKQGLGHWFEIHQLASKKQSLPIKNLKIDLYSMALYALFHCVPKELVGDDLQLSDLLGQTTPSLTLEEMEAANSGQELIRIAERYFLQHLWQQVNQQRLEISSRPP